MLWAMVILALISRPSVRRLVGPARSQHHRLAHSADGARRIVGQAAGGGRHTKLPKLSQVIADRGVEVQLHGNSIKARCPFHGNGNERTPSLSINDEKGVYHCFSCEASGNIVGFIEDFEGVSKSEALDLLAREYGLARSKPADPVAMNQAALASCPR